MARALNLFESWGAVSNPDSGLWQMAELLPGADAVAFAVHLQGGSLLFICFLGPLGKFSPLRPRPKNLKVTGDLKFQDTMPKLCVVSQRPAGSTSIQGS